MKKERLIMLTAIIALLSIASTITFYSFYKIKHIEYIPMDIRVGDAVGFNIDPDALHFGTVMSVGCSNRQIIVKHEYDYPVKVLISVKGELRDWTFIEQNDFILNPGEEQEVRFDVCTQRDAIKDKEYTGTASIAFKRV